MQIKTTVWYHINQDGHHPKVYKLNAGEGVMKREPSHTFDGNVNWYSRYGEQYGGSLKTKNRANVWCSSPTHGHTSGEKHG